MFFKKANSIFNKILSHIASHPGIYISCFLLIIAIAFYLPSLTKEENQRSILDSLSLEKESIIKEIDLLNNEKAKLESKIDTYGEEAEFWKEKADALESYLVKGEENE